VLAKTEDVRQLVARALLAAQEVPAVAGPGPAAPAEARA
jgi:hypothetical protein